MKLLHELAVQQMTTLSTLELKNLPGIEKNGKLIIHDRYIYWKCSRQS